MYDPFITTIC